MYQQFILIKRIALNTIKLNPLSESYDKFIHERLKSLYLKIKSDPENILFRYKE